MRCCIFVFQNKRVLKVDYMCAEKANVQRSFLGSVIACKCPRCRQGDLFLDANPYHLRTTTHMPKKCSVCGQDFELQTGFYFGTGYVSYAFAIMISVLTFIIWWFTIGISFQNNSLFWWLGVNAAVLILLQPVIQRFSRSMWIAFFVRYDKDWSSHKPASL